MQTQIKLSIQQFAFGLLFSLLPCFLFSQQNNTGRIGGPKPAFDEPVDNSTSNQNAAPSTNKPTGTPKDKPSPGSEREGNPSFAEELKNSATKANLRAQECVEIAEVVTDDPYDLAAVYLSCWTISVIEQTLEVTGKQNNCTVTSESSTGFTSDRQKFRKQNR